jgi:hypothetical protein
VTTDTDSSRLDLTVDGTTWWLHLDGYLDEAAVGRLDNALQALTVQSELPVVVRLTSSRYAPGALALLRQTLRRHHTSRSSLNQLTVRVDEPVIRAALPLTLMPTPRGRHPGDGDVCSDMTAANRTPRNAEGTPRRSQPSRPYLRPRPTESRQ